MPLHRYISAVSVGVVDGVAMADLCYEEDSAAEVDMNIIMTDEGNFVEVQGTGEHGTFTQEQLLELLALGRKAAGELKELQQAALDARQAACDALGCADTYVRNKPWHSVGAAAAVGVFIGVLLNLRR